MRLHAYGPHRETGQCSRHAPAPSLTRPRAHSSTSASCPPSLSPHQPVVLESGDQGHSATDFGSAIESAGGWFSAVIGPTARFRVSDPWSSAPDSRSTSWDRAGRCEAPSGPCRDERDGLIVATDHTDGMPMLATYTIRHGVVHKGADPHLPGYVRDARGRATQCCPAIRTVYLSWKLAEIEPPSCVVIVTR
jgi:hypothetical protein